MPRSDGSSRLLVSSSRYVWIDSLGSKPNLTYSLARSECSQNNRRETCSSAKADSRTLLSFRSRYTPKYTNDTTQEWDTARTKHTDALEDILESLGTQLVPPDFHQTSTDSSLFGSQHGSDDEHEHQSPFLHTTKSSTSHTHVGIGRGRTSITPSTSPMQSPPNKKHTVQHRPSMSPVSPSATLRRNGPVRPSNDSKLNGQGKGSSNPLLIKCKQFIIT